MITGRKGERASSGVARLGVEGGGRPTGEHTFFPSLEGEGQHFFPSLGVGNIIFNVEAERSYKLSVSSG